MSFATDGGYDDDLGRSTIRRPISVGELLEREGYRPAARSRATRRALTGVAAGAVLALGAVVGSLLLNHATNGAAGDTLASGSGGNDIVLSNHQPAVYPKTSSLQNAPSSQNTTQPQIVNTPSRSTSSSRVGVGRSVVQQSPSASSVAVAPAPVAAQSARATPATSTAASASSSSASSSAPSSSGAASTPSAPASTASPQKSGSSSSSSSGNGGLLGTVTGTLTGTLNSVTQPVFDWFNG